MKILFLHVAQRELDDAIEWYDHQIQGLGSEFLHEFNRVLHRIGVWPSSCPGITSSLRRCLMNRFPYGIIYGFEKDTVIVVAVAHLHREPSYWLSEKPEHKKKN